MNTFKEIRKELGLSQADLAAILNTTSSVVSMYELGHRPMTDEASLWRTRLQLAMYSNLVQEIPAEILEEFRKKREKVRNDLLRKKKDLEWKLVLLKRDLTEQEKKCDIAPHIRLLAIISNLKQQAVEGSIHASALALAYGKVRLHLLLMDRTKVEILQMRIRMAEKDIAEIDVTIDSLNE